MNVKKTITLFFFIATLVPFILVNSYFPFYRYGMFAEPAQKNDLNNQELLFIRYTFKSDSSERFNPESIGIQEGHFGYMLRNFYYLNNVQQVFSQLHQISKKKHKIHSWKLYRSFPYSDAPKDSLLLLEWYPNE